MGQYSYIIKINTRRHLGCWDKLGEFFSTPDDYGNIISLLEESWAGCHIMCVLTLEELDEIKTLPGTDAEKMFLTNTYKEIRAGEGYDLRGMVLRNLTKKFYVHRDVMVKEFASYRGDL
ncbi:hypothetical protein EV421DRAFT_1743023 [Armillaria borealis]|uniref:Uncharacterized protein n=1 Tax=Armillaria borealis TaxID=47425 RepID=A0AA39MF69_9AGAR|nr:hypothetical protein EV421DRAFT_1743023 [Armillaria borealis]